MRRRRRADRSSWTGAARAPPKAAARRPRATRSTTARATSVATARVGRAARRGARHPWYSWDMLRLLLVSLLALASSSCALLVSIGLGSERGRSNVFVRKSDDGIVFLERKPDDPRATVVLVHGFGGSKDHWTRFIAHIPSDVWVIAPDLPGFGDSPKATTESYDLNAQSARVTRFLDELEVGSFHLAGNSMGGHLSTLLALQMPERVQSLVLFNP